MQCGFCGGELVVRKTWWCDGDVVTKNDEGRKIIVPGVNPRWLTRAGCEKCGAHD
jgi:hypothetical protein